MNIYHVCISLLFFFFTDPPTPEIYTLSLHDALPISSFSRPRWRSSSSAPVRTPRKDISRRRAEGYLKMDQTTLVSHGDRLCAADRIQLGQDRFHVRLRRALGDRQAPRDVLVAAALRHQLQHIQLALR